MNKFAWNFDRDAERWNNGGCDTIEERIEEAIHEISDGMANYADDPTVVYIGEIKKFVPKVDVPRILDALEEQAFEECGEIGGDWQTYDWKKKESSDIEELANDLNKVIIDWLTKYNKMPNFYAVENIKEYPLNIDAGKGKN